MLLLVIFCIFGKKRKKNLNEKKKKTPGYHPPSTELLGFPKNGKLCIISTLNVYLKKTETVRKSEQLLVSFKALDDTVKSQ